MRQKRIRSAPRTTHRAPPGTAPHRIVQDGRPAALVELRDVPDEDTVVPFASASAQHARWNCPAERTSAGTQQIFVGRPLCVSAASLRVPRISPSPWFLIIVSSVVCKNTFL